MRCGVLKRCRLPPLRSGRIDHGQRAQDTRSQGSGCPVHQAGTGAVARNQSLPYRRRAGSRVAFRHGKYGGYLRLRCCRRTQGAAAFAADTAHMQALRDRLESALTGTEVRVNRPAGAAAPYSERLCRISSPDHAELPVGTGNMRFVGSACSAHGGKTSPSLLSFGLSPHRRTAPCASAFPPATPRRTWMRWSPRCRRAFPALCGCAVNGKR